MAVEFYEAHLTMSFSADNEVVRMTRTFNCNGTDDPIVVHETAVLGTPISYAGLWRESISKAENKGGGNWSIDVVYATLDPQQAYNPAGEGGTGGPGEPGGGTQPAPGAPGPDEPLFRSFTFDTMGGRKKITQSLATVFKAGRSGLNGKMDATDDRLMIPDEYTPSAADVNRFVQIAGGTGWSLGGYLIDAITAGKWHLSGSPAAAAAEGGHWYLPADDFKRAINVSGEKVEGCEIPVPQGHMTRKLTLPAITLSYYRSCKNLVGKTNNAVFYGFPIGAVLYLGMQGTPGQGGRTDVVHHFHDAEPLIDELVGTVYVPKVEPHDFVWCRYRPATSPINGTKLEVPAAVYVERVHKTGNFEILGIGH